MIRCIKKPIKILEAEKAEDAYTMICLYQWSNLPQWLFDAYGSSMLKINNMGEILIKQNDEYIVVDRGSYLIHDGSGNIDFCDEQTFKDQYCVID